MEAVEELPVIATNETVKNNVTDSETSVGAIVPDSCQKSNGIADSSNAAVAETPIEESIVETCEISDNSASTAIQADIVTSLETASVPVADTVVETTVVNQLENEFQSKTNEVITQEIIICSEIPVSDQNVVIETVGEGDDETVTFKTEVLVEEHNNDIKVDDRETSQNIIGEIERNIELNEVLDSSDVTDHVENNNGLAQQEVFNNEELLDILQGNDEVSEPKSDIIGKPVSLEAQIAMQQLSRLKNIRGVKKNQIKKKPAKKEAGDSKITNLKKQSDKSESSQDKKSSRSPQKKTDTIEKDSIKTTVTVTESENIIPSCTEQVKESIVNVLVKDWDDDEPVKEETVELVEQGDDLPNESDLLVQKNAINQDNSQNSVAVDAVMSSEDGETVASARSTDDGQPQRRLGRVIKKKVIFDPDNPDTFTKSKTPAKVKDILVEKDQPPPKKGKIEQIRSKSKSPVRMQWKKPSPKNSKQNKRLTEIDKLLMDEGAVNMIYQLTPEATKGKKNMKTKAEFIKKLQSSTPEGKEMKFRERKALKGEEAEAKKIAGGKQRGSMSSSVKSPSGCDDFETHSADDSIIYRRHSSSSYSSSCMSPRRLSDVDGPQNISQTQKEVLMSQEDAEGDIQTEGVTDVFMSDITNTSTNDVINKSDCLSIKEKLNSKLSSVLNKRKREVKVEKPNKQKKTQKIQQKRESKKKEEEDNFKYLSINFDQRLAEINIQKTGSKYTIETLRELERALAYVNSKQDITVTMLTSECGTLCSEIDLSQLLDDNMEQKLNYACEIAESVRSLLCCVEQHSKILCSGVWGACSGVALALVALCDVALAAESATFSAAAPPLPGLAALTAHASPVPRPLVQELVVLGRTVCAAEAARGGLLARAVWTPGARAAPARLRDIARDLAAQPPQHLLLKKQLLNLKKNSSEPSFVACLAAERDLLVEYWTSVEGQDLIRAHVDTHP